MANVRVAVRVRPLSKKETKDGGRIIVEVDGKVAKIRNLKVANRPDGFGDSREKVVAFGFDYCYWSVNPEDPQYASQDVVFQDLGTEVLSGAAEGYNICLFAYGQTGSGKTYTMLGTPASIGLTPRICEGLFDREEDYASLPSSCRIKVSFLEIYNERVRDLLKQPDHKKSYTLRVREHPEMGPYVQGLSQHVVTNYKQVIQLLEEGIANRITAATHVHEASSRSHAIFTIYYTQAILENNLPSEIASKINLVDLAGSERADPSYCKDRITEGANINKSLVTLGIVISTLGIVLIVWMITVGGRLWKIIAQNSQVFSSCQSLSSTASDGGERGIPSPPSGISRGGGTSRRQSYIPYRDSVLTWLLKDCLGGNSKTIMVATVSPAHTSYNETLSTLRYASNAQNIINKPRVNEDANVKLIRELREEIKRLKAMLLSFELLCGQSELFHTQWNFSSLNDERDENLKELVLQNELKIDQLTKDWTQKWNDWKVLMEHYRVDINRRRAGVVIDSTMPHLMALEDDVLSTGVVLYHLKEGTTKIGRIDSDQEQDIVLQGQWIERDHCTITSACGVVILRPAQGARCTVNGREITASCRLTQGAVITLGKAQNFRFNHPAEAAVLRQRRQVRKTGGGSGSLEWLDLDGDVTGSQLSLCPWLWKKRRVLEEQCGEDPQQQRAGETSHRVQIRQQQCYVEDLRQEILAGQIRAEQELEFDQTRINQQIKDNQQRLLREETWLASFQQQQQQDYVAEGALEASVAPDVRLQTDSEVQPSTLAQSQKRAAQQQLLRRHALRAAERTVRRKKVTFQLEKIIKKQRLLEAQKRLEHLKALCWLQDDSIQKSPDKIPGADAMVPGPQHGSKSTSYSSLSLQRLCSQHLPQPPSVFLESANIQEMERVSEQPYQMMFQGSASLSQSANKPKPKDEPEALTPTTWTRRAKGITNSSHMQAEWQKEGTLGTHKTAKGIGYSFSHPCEPKQAAGHGKTAKTFQTEAKPASPNRASKRQWRVLAARARDIAKKSSHLPHGNPLKRQHTAGDLDTMAPTIDSSLVVDHERENDFSDIDSNYSVHSLSCICAKALREPLKTEEPQGKKLDFPELENSESDNSQISEDSLAEKGYQTQKYSPEGTHLTKGHGHHKARTRTSVRSFTIPLDSEMFASAHRSFSLDSLTDAEEEMGESQPEEPLLGSADEMPTETFWRLQNSSMPIVDQKAMSRLGAVNEGIGVRQDGILPTSSSFYLDPQFQPHCGQPEPAMEACYSEQANSLQGMQLSRGSPLRSMDSWFSCDSRINPTSPPGTVGSFCPSSDVQEFQSCVWERPGYWITTEEPKPSVTETVLPYHFQVLQGSGELPCNSRDVDTIPVSDTSMLSFMGIHRFLQAETDGIFQGRGIPNISQQDESETSNNSSMSSMLAASAASFMHISSAYERDWTALQQKYLLELSHPCLEAIEEPKPDFPCLEEDFGSLAQASGKGGDSLPEVSSSLDLKNVAIHLSKIRHLRAEKEQDSLSTKLEGTSDLFRTDEKEANCNGISSTDLDSLTSGTTNAQIFAGESKIPNSMIAIREIKPNNLEECPQGSREHGLITSSDECFLLKNPCHSSGTIIATKENSWPQGWAPLMENIVSQSGQLRHKSYHPLQEEEADCQESSKEVVGRDTKFSFAFSSDPEPDLHCTPWAPFPSSLQPPPLETFYVTKSRDALTETALEIPACREAGVPSLPLQEAWAFGHGHQVLQDVYLKDNFPGPLQNQNSKIDSSSLVAAERPVNLNTGEVIVEIEKCPGNIKEESCNSVYFSVSQNGHFLLSTSTKVCEFENQIGILNIKHSLLTPKGREKATVQSCCNVSPNNSGSGKPVLVCESKAGGEEEQGQKAVLRQTQAFDINRHFPSGTMSDFIHKTINLGLEKDIPEETATFLKSRSVDHSVSSPVIVAQDESSSHKWEGKNATGQLRKAPHPRDSLEELKLPGADSAYERFQSVTSSKERNPNDCKGPGKPQEMLNPKEPSGKKQNKRVSNAEEMARLIRSVVQLENGILEIESKQNKQLLASQIPRVSKEIVFQNWKNQEKTEHVLRPGSSEDPLSFKDQPPSPKQKDIVIFRDSEAEEMKELNICIGKDPQVEKVNLSPFEKREYIEKIKFMREHNHPDGLERSSKDTCDYLGIHTAHREPANTSVHSRKMTALSRALPFDPRSERSFENEDELFKASASPKGQPCGLGSLEELETVKGAEHINKQEKPKVQGRVEEMAMQRGGSLQEKNKMVSTQKFCSPSQVFRSKIFSQKTVCPLLSQADYSIAPSQQDLSNTLPSSSPSLARNCLHAPDTIGVSSADYMLDPTMLKFHKDPLVTGVGDQDQSEKTKSHGPQENARGGSSLAHSSWCGCAITMAMGSHSQPNEPESMPLGADDRISASTTPQDKGGDLRGTLMDLSTREGFVPEAGATVQREIKTLNGVSSQLEKRTSCPLEDGNYQGREIGQKTENNTKDFSLTSDVLSVPVSLLRVPNPESKMLETSAHTSVYLVMLEEIRPAQNKQLTDFVVGGTALPCHETFLESECSSGVPERPQCKQMGESVSDRTRNEGEAQEFDVAFPFAEPGHLLTDEREVLQVTPLCADSFQLLPNTEMNKRAWHASQASSHDIPALGKGDCTGDLRRFLGVGEQFTWHSGSSKITQEKKEATRTPYFAGSLGSDCLPSSAATEENRREVLEKIVPALFSQAPSDVPGLVLHARSHLAPCESAGAKTPGSWESSPEYQEPRILDTTYGGSPDNLLVNSQPEKQTCFESQSVICGGQNSACFSEPKQDQVKCLERSTGLDEVKPRPKQGSILSGDLKKAELEESSQQCVKWKGSSGFGLAEARRAGRKHPGPTLFPDQRPSPYPEGVREEAPFRCPEETQDCIISGSTDDISTLSPSVGQEESKTLPSQQLCNSQPIAPPTGSSLSSSLFCYGDGDLEKGPCRAALGAVRPPCIVPSRACGIGERGERSSREYSLESTGINMESGPTDSHILVPSETAANLALAQSCSSRLDPDVRTTSFSHSRPRSVEGPEKKCFEKRTSTELKAVPLPIVMYSELLKKFQNGSLGDQSAPVPQTKPEPPTKNGRPDTLNLSGGSVESELAVEPQHRYLDGTFRCLPKKPQLSMESRDHSSLDPQAKFVAKLKYICSTQADSLWEEEEQQKHRASGDGKAPAQGGNPPPSDEGGSDGSQINDSRIEEKAVAKPESLSTDFIDSATVFLGQSSPQPSAERLGQSTSDREQPPPHHRYPAPVIAVFSGPRHSLKTFPRPQLSVVSNSRSLHELNLSVEPPSPTDEDNQGPNRLWNPHPQDPRDDYSGVLTVKTSLEAEDCDQKASSNLDGRTADHRSLKPATPPYPVSSALSCMPTPDFMASWMSGTLEQAWEGRPEKCLSKVDKGMLHFGSSDIDPYNLPWHPERPGQIGWKQYVFGGAVDVSCSRTSQGVIPSNVAQCSSMDNGLKDQNFAFYSHLGTYSKAQNLSSTCGSIENIQCSNDALEIWGSSFALGDPHIMTGTDGAAPMRGPNKRSQFKALPNKVGCLKSESPVAEGSASGPLDEIMLLPPSEAVRSVGQARKDTFEQGTQTVGCRLNQHCTDVSSAKSEASATAVSDLASWTSMHNLSLHLSQLLHSTSELLGNLSQPSMPEKEQNTKNETPDEAPPTLMMDGCTQTPVDKGSQTDLASLALPLQAPDAKPQEVNVNLEVLGSNILTVSQDMGDAPVALQEREATEAAQGTAGPPDLQEESIQCRPQKPPVPSSYLKFQKAPLGQNLPFLSPQASGVSLPPSSQPEVSSCLAVSRHSLSISQSPESTGEPRTEKQQQGPKCALLVDRASSPILTLSASTQGSCLPPHCLFLSAPSAHTLEGHWKLDSSPDLPLGAPRPPMDNYSQTTEELAGSQGIEALCGEGRSPLEKSDGSSLGNMQQSPKFQVNFLGQPSQQLQSSPIQIISTRVQSGQLSPQLRSRSPKLAISFVPEGVASPEHGPLSSRGRSQWQSSTENGGENSALIMKSQPTPDRLSLWAGLKHLSACPISELTDTVALQGSALGPLETCHPEGLLSPSPQVYIFPEPQHHSLRNLPMHNKFRNWGGVQGGSSGGQGANKELGIGCDLSSGEQVEMSPQPPEDKSQDPEWSQGKQVPLQVGAQNFPLSMELTEARLHHGIGEADALLHVLQSGTGTALAPDEHAVSTWMELYARQKKTIETLQREQAKQLENFCRTQSLSPQKEPSLLPSMDFLTRDLDLPSRRREYLQQLRKDVVETTRQGSPETSSRPAHPPSDVELMLRDYRQAREQAKVEIARARDRLRERTEQEKLRIRQQIVFQLLREEEKLHTLANASPLCTSSNGSLSSGLTSGYNSNPALSGQLQSPESLGYTDSPDSREPWLGDGQGRTVVRNRHLYPAGSTWKSSAHGHRASLGSCCYSLSSQSGLGPCFSSSYQDLAKRIVDISVADVMAACSNNLHNLFNHQAAAGWKYQGEEQEVQLYYKVFSSTRHGFLGAGVVCQPLPQVWAAVSDPTLWPLYHKPIQTARLHHRVTNSINLVYLVCDTTLCALTQPRDFCCVCVEAKEGHLSIMAAQSVYDASMPRPSREMVRGEILPSAWILQPLTVNGQEITRVILLSQVELGAPGFPAQLLNSFIKQQPLVVARLASFLGS